MNKITNMELRRVPLFYKTNNGGTHLSPIFVDCYDFIYKKRIR